MIAWGWSAPLSSAMGALMDAQNKRAGGCFWMATILIGTIAGVAGGNPMKGVLIGTAAGAAIALAVFLADRLRR